MTSASFSLRSATPNDRDHLFRVYASTRADELAVVPWSPVQKDAFLRQQFDVRESEYTRSYGTDHHDIVMKEETPIGYLWVVRTEAELKVLDIALLPEHRNGGIGTALMTPLIEEARSRKLPLRLYVLTDGPARRLYERLGFTAVASSEASVYQLMELLP